MNKFLCRYLVEMLLQFREVSEDEKSIYLYGTQILLEKVENLLCIFFFIIIYRSWIEGILFIFIYTVLRKEGGGYHAKTPMKCVLCTIIITNLFFLFLEFSLLKIESMPLFVLLLFLIYIIAPVDSFNNPLNGNYKKNKLLVILIMLACAYAFFLIENEKIANAIFMIVCIYITMLIMGIKDSPRYRRSNKLD